MRKIVLALFLVFLTLIQTRIYLNGNFPYTHDGQNHLARFANFKIALKEGQFPPRLAPNLFHRYGYPVFNYNYPLANIASVPFSAVNIHPEVAFKMIATIGIFLGLSGLWLWLGHLGYSRTSKIFSLIAFTVSPYLTKILIYQGNIGELLVMMIIPWILWEIEEIKSDKKHPSVTLPILGAMYLLSHNVTVLFATPFLILYAALRLYNDVKGFQGTKLAATGFSALLACGFSTWFWIPAIFEKDQVTVGEVSLTQFTVLHFPTIQQLLFSPLQFGFSFPYAIDSLSFQIGWIQWVSLILCIIIVVKTFLQYSFRKVITTYSIEMFLLLAAVILMIFQLSVSQTLWQIIPFVSFIQFPWRLTLLISIFIVPLLAFTFESTSRKIKVFLVCILLLQLILTLRLQPIQYLHQDSVEYDLFTESTSTQNENRAKTFTLTEYIDWQPTPIINGNGKAQVTFWNGSLHQYQLSLQSESIIIEPTMYFLGWQTYRIDSDGKKNDIDYIFTEDTKGRIAFSLPAGEYTIETRFTQDTLARMLGNSLTVISIGIFIGYSIVRRKFSENF